MVSRTPSRVRHHRVRDQVDTVQQVDAAEQAWDEVVTWRSSSGMPTITAVCPSCSQAGDRHIAVEALLIAGDTGGLSNRVAASWPSAAGEAVLSQTTDQPHPRQMGSARGL